MKTLLITLSITIASIASARVAGAQEASPAVVNPAVRWQQQAFLSLDGTWSFSVDPRGVGEKENWFRPGAAWPEARPMPVPGCWEAQGVGKRGECSLLVNTDQGYVSAGMKGEYEGTAWYRKEVSIPASWAGRQVWIKFGGVNAQGWAYVNGALVAHLGGPDQTCGTFKYNVTRQVTPGQPAVIVIKVRNDVPSSKGGRVVARRYGGIERSVELEATPALLIDYADVVADAGKQLASVKVKLWQVSAATNTTTRGSVTVVVRDPQGKIVGRLTNAPVNFTGTLAERAFDVPLSPCRLWTPNDPVLHTAEIALSQDGKIVHGWTERFGVVNWSVRGSDLLLNGKKWFVRGVGFDAHWPLEVCYPTDRARLREFITKVKSFGYNHIRHWAHTPVPEFCEIADEEGVSLTVEMPYYHSVPNPRQGRHADPLPSKEYNRPLPHLQELLTHYRRYASVFTFSGGNEGHFRTEKNPAVLLQAVRAQAPGKLWTINSGHVHNKPGVSDYNVDYFIRTGGQHIPNFPHVFHEFFNPAYPGYDPRLETKYTGGYLPPIPLANYRQHVERTGLAWPWVEATLKAGDRMLSYYQKVAVENARGVSEHRLSGYHMWGSVNGDTHFFGVMDGGLLDPFLGQKNSTPEYFRTFNRDAVLLCKIAPKGKPYRSSIVHAHGSSAPKTQVFPEQVVFVAGDEVDIEFWLSNFADAGFHGELEWTIRDGDKVVAQGKSGKSAAEQGGLAALHKTTWTVPKLARAARLTVTGKLPGTSIENRWDIWAFPTLAESSRPLTAVAATKTVYEKLKPRYAGLQEWTGDKVAAADLLLTDDAGAANAACQLGKRVLLLGFGSFTAFNPTVYGGEWGPNMQMGTAIVDHPAFRGFPCQDFLEPVFTRLVKQAVPMGPAFKGIEPLMVGMARHQGGNGWQVKLPDFLVYAFEAKAGTGRLLATGMDLLSENAEAACLLNSFIAYAQSDEFKPTGQFEIKSALAVQSNGLGKILQRAGVEHYELFLGPREISVTRSAAPAKPLVWETTEPPKLKPNDSWKLVCLVGMGTLDEKPVTFLLQINNEPAMEIPFVLQRGQWRSPGGVSVNYNVIESATNVTRATINRDIELATVTGVKSRERQSSGILTITVPARLIAAGRPLTLKVTAKPSAGRGWFGLIDNRETQATKP